MKRTICFLSLIFLVLFLPACGSKNSKTVSPAAGMTNKIAAMVQNGSWSGYYFDTSVYLVPPVSFHREIADTIVTIVKASDESFSIPGVVFSSATGNAAQIKYAGTDSVKQRARYEVGDSHDKGHTSIYYYYAVDSVTLDYDLDLGSEGWVAKSIHLNLKK